MSFDKHIPPPKIKHPAFRQMDVGDSVFVPYEGSISSCPAYAYAATIQRRSDVFQFAGRTVVEKGVKGVRIWRTR